MSARRNHPLEQAIRKLLRSEWLACDAESGLCRFCGARVEHHNEELLEPHRRSCAWQRARSYYFPAPARLPRPPRVPAA